MTQFEGFNHVNMDATDETKIVTTKFVLGFCHGQLRFCLLVRIGPLTIFNPLELEGTYLAVNRALGSFRSRLVKLSELILQQTAYQPRHKWQCKLLAMVEPR